MKWWTFWQSKEFIRKELVLFTNFEDINELNERNGSKIRDSKLDQLHKIAKIGKMQHGDSSGLSKWTFL
ncbi:hypothetical protein CKAN_01962800 [Cinnamomum micranthum f. kanehirae]|uniref:Uncharacterized protein n=1 Tax=Cinnamomum micranthum f. kanehirae TaxID=337451 RepID=A0A3S3NE99_9MAGN|nr:hypothetical protein CKAN_01962800 [Cinnamomum micranthum f. kanehirae]